MVPITSQYESMDPGNRDILELYFTVVKKEKSLKNENMLVNKDKLPHVLRTEHFYIKKKN